MIESELDSVYTQLCKTMTNIGETQSSLFLARFALLAVQLMQKGGPFEKGRLLILGGPDDWRTSEPLRRS